MGSSTSSGRFKPLLFEDVPLADDARDVRNLKIARPSGYEHLLKCKAPSPERTTASPYNYTPCTEFLAKAYFDETKSPFRDVCVFFNGLDETPHSLNNHELFGFYDALGRTLAENGMLSILLPSPFHLNRSLVYKSNEEAARLRASKASRFLDMTRPSNAMLMAPHNLYINHYQSFRELISLYRSLAPGRFEGLVGSRLASVCATRNLLPTETSNLLGTKLSSDARFSIIGYSMGALRAMTAFCYTWEMAHECEEEPLFVSCVALNAGGSFSSMRAPSWVDSTSWKAMVHVLNLETFERKLEGEFSEERDVFQQYCKTIRDVTLGNGLKFKQLHDRDPEFTRRLLFVLGGSDDIVRLSSLHRITPPGGLNIFHVAGVGHMFRHGEWGTHLRGMLDHVAKFVVASSLDAGKLSSHEIAEFLSLVDWHLGMLPFDSKRIVASGDDAGDIARASAKLEELDLDSRLALAALFLLPIDSRSEDGAEDVQLILERLGEERAARIAEEAIEFVKDGLLLELRLRIEKGECHPGLYRQTRRALLLGWLMTKNKILVKHWSGFARNGETRIGEELVEHGVVPKFLVDSALQEQRSLLESARARMLRVFSLTCGKKGLSVAPEGSRASE